MKSTLDLLLDKHDKWIYMVTKYGCNRDTSEDIVQEMYLRVITYIKKTGNDITYKDDINVYFIAKTLKSIFIDHIRKENRKTALSYDDESYCIGQEDALDYESAYSKVQAMLENMYWFDKKIYEIIESGVKVSELSEKTKIPYYTIYNTYKKVKNYLKENI